MRRLGDAGASASNETENLTKMETVGLYDVTHVSTILPMVPEDGSLAIESREAWKLKWASNERFLVLASCSDLTIFSLGVSAEYFFSTSLGGTITDFVILGNSCFLVVIVDNNKIVTLSLEKQEVYYKESSPFPIDFVRCKTADDICFLTFGSYSGQCHFTSFQGEVAEPKENNRIENWQNNQIVDFFTKAFAKTTSRNINMKNVCSPVISISNGPVQSWASIDQQKNFMFYGFNAESFLRIGDGERWVQVRDTGRYALLLSEDGFIHVFDPLTLMFCHKFDIKCRKDAHLVDFIAIDHHISEVPTLFAIVAIINGTTEMMIYDQQKKENCFSISCAPQTVLFGYSGSDRMLMSVEEVIDDSNDLSKNKIVIRQVSQSRPEMRFEALLKSHRFEEAEKFAMTYKLDVQRVYKSRVSYFLDRCDNDDDTFSDMLKTLDLITDHNMVADTYFALVAMSRRFDRIHTYLCQAKKRKITDMEILKQIENASFILATYRIIIGPKSRSQNDLSDRIWELFVDALHGAERWVELYTEFISIAAITEARVIWSRHGTSILDFIFKSEKEELEEKLDGLFRKFLEALSSDVNSWSGVIEHVTVDLFPDCLDSSVMLVPRIEDLVKHLVRLLEYRDVENWPDNAIKVSSCFDNMTQMLSDNCVTPSDQSFLALKGRVLCAPDERKSTPLLRMKKLLHVLQDIKRLKEVYGCNISHSTYLNLTPEEICHKILQNAIYNPNTIHAEIEKNVKPFMAERHLNQDQTIFNYIQIMSGGSKVTANNSSSGWEKQCVHLCSSLSDESKKCQSIISIASSAKLPWPSVLEEAVEKILNSRTLSRAEIEEMQIVCRKTELTRLLSHYGYDRSFINLFTDDDAMIDIILVIRCVLAQVEKPARFVDCIKILELFTFVQKTEWGKAVNVEYARAQTVIQLVKSGDMTASIINYINDLNEQDRENVTNLVVSFIKCVADTPAPGSNIAEREAILNVGEELLSYTTRRGKAETEEYRNLHKKLILIRELQKVERSAVLLSDFENDVWKMSQLRRMRKSDEPLNERLTKCVYIGIEYERLVGEIIAEAMDKHDVRKILDVFIESVESVGTWVPASKELVDLMCELLGWIIYRLPNLSADMPDLEKAEDIAIVVETLTKGIRTMIGVFPFEIISDEFDYLMQVEAFLCLSGRIVKQSLRGQGSESMRNQDLPSAEESNFLNTTNGSSPLRIYGFARRHGIFDFSSDPALFEGVSGVLAIAGVAPSVARPFDSEIKDELANEYRASWEHLTMFLAMHSQDLLDISSRVFASSLRCFSGEWRQSIVEIGQSVLSVTERMLHQNKFDAWHAATLLCALPTEQIPMKVSELRTSNGAKRNTQSQLNFLQLAFFMSILTKKDDMLPAILSSYEQKHLVKQLAKEGIRASIGQSQDIVDKIISQAAELSTPLAPNKLREYVKKILEKFMRNHTISVSEYMVRYASILIRKASVAGAAVDSKQRCVAIERYLDLASSSLFLVDEGMQETVCNYLSCLLYVVCPYNYEVIQFISHKIKLHASTKEYSDFYQNLQNIMTFLWLYKRTSHITREESVWFTKRERTLFAGEKEYDKYASRMSDPFGYQLRTSYEGTSDQLSETMGSETSCPADAMVYEKNDVVISDIPPLSSKRIPFHVFLMRKKQDIDDIVMPIVKAELSIYNVPIWQAALRNVSWLSSRFSRTQLLSSAIFSHANKFATVEKTLPEGDKTVIYQLLDSTTNRSVVISTIALLFKKIMLSDVKIDLLQMGVDMAERWVRTENIDPPIKSDEREAITEQCFRLKDGIAKFFTELALKKNGLYNEKTADNIENVEELCTIIYDEMVDWTNTIDVEEKCTIVEKIAEANGLDLTRLHEKLLYGWVDDTSASAVTYEQLDMNDSLGDTSYMDRQVDDAQAKDDITRLPLFDRSVEKMTFLSKRIEKKSLLKKLASVVIKSGANGIGGYNAVARATCILLRSSTEEEMTMIHENASHFWICANLETQMYSRLHDMTNIKVQTDVENVQLIRTLLQCPSRTPTMTGLIACLMMDQEYKDVKSIEQIMARLQIGKQWNVLKALLGYSRNHKLDSMIRSFPLLWFRVYENALTELNGGSMINKNWSNSQCVSFRKWSLWAMGSNVEGGRQTGVSRLLRELSCPVSAAIASVLSNFTIDQMDDVSMSSLDAKRDLPMLWAKTAPSSNQAVPNVKMEY